MPGPRNTKDFFHYVDADGRDVVVDDIRDVPEAQRTQAARVKMEAPDLPPPPRTESPAASGTAPSAPVKTEAAPAPARESFHVALAPRGGGPWTLDLPSFGLGLVIAAVVTVLLSLLRGTGMRIALQVILMVMLVGTVSTVYVTWIQQVFRAQAGMAPASSPTQIIDDARAVRDEQDRATREAQKVLDTIP